MEIGSQILSQYGVSGFVVVTCLLTLTFVLKDLLKKSDRKDEQMKEIGLQFAKSLDANTVALNGNVRAINGLNESEIKRAATNEKFQEWLADAKDSNREDLKEILGYVRKVAR